MALASSSSSAWISYHFRSQELIFTSTFVSLNGRRVFGSIKAVQKTSLGKNPRRRTQNVEGDIFVDSTCIDCDTCRWMVPGVFHCGFHSKKSYGATPYFVLHSEGNILVDSPRYTEKLAKKIEMMGGVRYMFLTHRDDVADHKKWADRFKCTRILHSGDVEPSTSDVELKLEGSGPWSLYEDVELIHTPGHTKGSVCLFHKPLKALFTGDHVTMFESGMSIIELYNHCSVPLQLKSVEKLINLDFNWLIPGHGRRVHFKDGEEKAKTLEALIQKHREKQLVSSS